MSANKKYAKILSLILVALMVLAIIPATAIMLAFAEGDTPVKLADDFEDEDITSPLISFAKGAELITDGAISGNQSLLVRGLNYINTDYFPHEISTAEAVVIRFKMKLVTIPDDIAYSGYLLDHDLINLNIGSTGKLTSNTDISSILRVFGNDDGDISFSGGLISGGITPNAVIADNDNGVVNFAPYDVYDIKITLTGDRCYIDINDGAISTSFANARDAITDFRIYINEGVDIIFDDFEVYSEKQAASDIDPTLKRLIDAGAFTGYLEQEVVNNGVVFYRHTKEQRVKNSIYNNIYTYKPGVMLDFYTNSRNVSMTVKVIDESSFVPQFFSELIPNFEVYINGNPKNSSKCIPEADKTYIISWKISDSEPEYNRITIMFPDMQNIAVQSVQLDDGALIAPVKKDANLLVLGDEITEGRLCLNPSVYYPNLISMNFNYNLLNQAMALNKFSESSGPMGDYNGFEPDYIIIALGINDYSSGVFIHNLYDLDNNARAYIDKVKEYFPNSKIIAITPIWRYDYAGYEYTLGEFSDRLKSIYAEYPDIYVIDGIDFVPHSSEYYVTPSHQFHLNGNGYMAYYTSLEPELIKAGMTLSTKDWAAEATKVFTPSDWAKGEVDTAKALGLVPPALDLYYTDNITRSDFCDLVVNMIEVKSGKKIADFVKEKTGGELSDKPFPDISSANVNAASKLGIVNGRTSGDFDPEGSITRQEAAKMLALAAKALGADISASDAGFTDSAKIADWAKEYINFVFAKGVMNGTGNNSFSPASNYTREQSILTILRLFNSK